MGRARVIVVGGGLAGLTTALAVARTRREGARAGAGVETDVTVVSTSDRLVFSPSLVRVALGERTIASVSFPVAPTLAEHEIGFLHDTVTRLDLDARQVHTARGDALSYDYLVVATGAGDDTDAVPGVGPGQPAGTITTADGAADVADRWDRLLDRLSDGDTGDRSETDQRGETDQRSETDQRGDDGDRTDIVVAVAAGARHAAAAYEYLFALPRRLARAGLGSSSRLTFVTAEPALGSFAGQPAGDDQLVVAMRADGIRVVTDAAVARVEPGRLVLAGGAELPFAHAVVVPPSAGGHAIRAEGKITDADGYVRVRDGGQSESYDEVYAVGATSNLPAPWRAPAAVGLPASPLTIEQQANRVARSIAAQASGGASPTAEQLGSTLEVGPRVGPGARPAAGPEDGLSHTAAVLDAGEHGLLVLADELRPPRNHGVLVPWPQSRALTLAAERYLLWRVRQGLVAVA